MPTVTQAFRSQRTFYREGRWLPADHPVIAGHERFFDFSDVEEAKAPAKAPRRVRTATADPEVEGRG